MIFNARSIGHCLELAVNGILNEVPCTNTFEEGCPENHFFSDEIFNCKSPLGHAVKEKIRQNVKR